MPLSPANRRRVALTLSGALLASATNVAIASGAPPAQAAPVTLTTGLAKYLPFENSLANSGSVAGDATSHRGNARYTTGKLGRAATFKNNGGSGQPNNWAASLGKIDTLYEGDFTVSMWVRTTATNSAALFGNKTWGNPDSTGYAVSTDTARNLNVKTADAARADMVLHPPMSDGAWHLVTSVVDRAAGTVTAYIDGVVKEVKPIGSGTLATGLATLIGSSGAGNFAGNGDIDDLGIWTRALGSGEVARVFALGEAGTALGGDTLEPSAPANLRAVSSPGGVSLTWDAATDNVGVTGYRIVRDGALIATVTGTSHVDAGVTVGSSHTYTVEALDLAGNVSAASTPATVSATDLSAPSAPANVAASITPQGVRLTWTAATDNVAVAGYEVLRDGLRLATPTATEHVDTTAEQGRNYTYTVLATDAAGNVSVASAPATISVPDTTAPSAPAGLTATIVDRTVELTWQAATDNVGVTTYRVLRNGTEIGSVTGSSYVDATPPVGQTLTYTVVAADAAGNASAPSNAASANLADTTAPSVPTGLAAASSQDGVHLTWTAATDNVGVVEYRVLRDGREIATTTGTGHVDPDVRAGATHSYAVVAVDAAGNASAASAAATVTVLDREAPSVPADLAAKVRDGAVELTWAASTDNVAVTSYSVFRDGELIATTTETSHRDAGAAVGIAHSYTVTASDAAGNHSAASAAATAELPDTSAPTAPTGLTATSTVGEVSLTWSAASDNVAVTAYRVMRNGEQVAETTAGAYTDRDVTAGDRFTYTVVAVDAAGNISAASNSVAVVVTEPNPAPNAAPVVTAGPGAYRVRTDSPAGHVVAKVTATDADGDALTYSMVGGEGLFAVDAATGTITVAGPLGGATPRMLDVTVSDGRASAVAQVASVVVAPSESGITRQVWTGISGSAVSNLTSAAAYPASPNLTETLAGFPAPSNWADSYGQRVIGYLVPPTTGEYTLGIQSDDGAELWLNPTGAHAGGQVLLASSNYYNGLVQAAPMTLTAGQLYLLTVLHKDGGGSDHLTVSWTGPGITTRANIGAEHLLPLRSDLPMTAPVLSAAAQRAQVDLSWTAAQTSATSVTYRVFRDGAQIGETAALTYRDTGLATGAAHTYRVEAIGDDGRTSRSTEVRVVTRNNAPVMLGAGGHYAAAVGAPKGTVIGHVQAADADSADAPTYRLTGGAGVEVDPTTGAVALSEQLVAGGPALRTFEVTATDGVAEATAEYTMVVSTDELLGANGITRQVWHGIDGGSVADLTAHGKFPNSPDSTSVISSTSAPTNTADDFGARMVGYVTPPQTGEYTFWVASDDASELKVSPSTDPAGAGAVTANVPTHASVGQWTKFPSQRTTPMTLVSGQRYYVEFLHKENGGADHATLAWQGPGMTGPETITSQYLLPFSALDSVAPTAPRVFAVSKVDAEGVSLAWTAASDPNGIGAYRLFRGSERIAELPGDALRHTDTGAQGTVEYHLEAVDTFGNVSSRMSTTVNAEVDFDAIDHAIDTGDSSKLTDPEAVRAEAADTIDAGVSDVKAIQAALFNLNADGTAKSDGSSLTSIDWDPTHDSALIKSSYPGSHSALRTNAVFDTAYTVKDRELGVVGTRGDTKFMAFGSNPFRSAARGYPINEQMHQFMMNSMGWLTDRSDLTQAPFKVVISQMDQSYYYPDENSTRTWLDARYPGKVSYNAADKCDGAALAGCLTPDTDLLIVSQAGSDDPAVVSGTVRDAMARGIPVLYLHWSDTLRPIGTELFSLLDVNWEADNYHHKLKLAGYDVRGSSTLPAQIESIRTILDRLADGKWKSSITGCTGHTCTDPVLASEFYAGAKDYLQARLQYLDARGLDLFASPGYDLEKRLVILGDTLRQEISYPLSTGDLPTWMRGYFADHVVYNNRTTNAAQLDPGSFSKVLRTDLPVFTEDVSVVSKESTHFTAAGLYALPGKPYTVSRTDAGTQQVWVAVNSVRSGSTDEFIDGAYDRPKYLASAWLELKAGQTMQLSSPYGGPLQVRVAGTGVGAQKQTATVRFEGVGKHAVWKGADTTEAFTAALAANDYDWAEYITDGFQMHAKVDRLRETLANPRHTTPEQLAAVTYKYFYQSIFNLAGFAGEGLGINPTVAALCQANGWDCTDPTVHGMFTVTHFNADQATCGYGCAGNPYDAWWAFDPLGWGDAHEVGHGLQRSRMHIEGATSEVSNNIFSNRNVYGWNSDHPEAPVRDGYVAPQAKVFSILNDAQKTADPKATVKQAIWVNAIEREKLEFYRQLVHQAYYLPQFGDGGWDLITGLYLADRIYGKATANDTTWAAQKDSLGFSTYTRAMATSVTSNDWMLLTTSHLMGKDQRPVFDMWGISYSAAASAQLDARSLPAAEKVFYVVPKDASGNYYIGDNPVGSVPVDGVSQLP